MNQHRKLQEWVEEMAWLCEPEHVVWIDGSEEEKDALVNQAVSTGEVSLLNQEKLPGCLYHRTAVNDVARTEDLTYICTTLREDAGPTNNWMSPEEGYHRASEIFKGSMKGRTMYVIPFSMGPVGSPFSKVGVELTDSIYVVLNMRIMTHVGAARAEATRHRRRVHPVPARQGRPGHPAPLDPALSRGQRRSGASARATAATCCWARSAWPCGSPAILGRREGWLAEHMLIMGVENPDGPGRVRRGRVPQRLRQDQSGDDGPARGPEGQGLPNLDRGRRHRLDADRHRRPAVGHQSGDRLLRRRTGHEREDQPQHDEDHPPQHDLHQRRVGQGRHGVVGRGRRRAARRGLRLAGPPMEARA